VSNQQQAVFTVPDMSCMHCVKAIEGALGKLVGVSAVQVDLATKEVRVQYDAAFTDRKALTAAIVAAGYQPQS